MLQGTPAQPEDQPVAAGILGLPRAQSNVSAIPVSPCRMAALSMTRLGYPREDELPLHPRRRAGPAPMKPRISFVTLGVDDLERAVAFYRDGLGLATQGIVGTAFEHGAVAFFDMQPGLKLALWPRRSLAADAGLTTAAPGTADFALAHNVDSRDAVDALLAQAQRAGATIVKPAGPTFYGGHAGYFRDLDGHLWEIAFNPGYEAL
jgi:uncharacterized protein